KGSSFVRHFRNITFALATLSTIPGCFGQVGAPAPSSNSEIAWFWMGRAGFNPANGNVLPYGYFTIINGMPGNIFGGLPNETTAFFTFRYTVFQSYPLTANLDQNILLTGPALL